MSSISDADIERLKASVPDGLNAERWRDRIFVLAIKTGSKLDAVDDHILRVLAERAGIVGPSADGEIPGPPGVDESTWCATKESLRCIATSQNQQSDDSVYFFPAEARHILAALAAYGQPAKAGRLTLSETGRKNFAMVRHVANLPDSDPDRLWNVLMTKSDVASVLAAMDGQPSEPAKHEPMPSRPDCKELRAAVDEAVWAVKRHTLARPDDVVDIVFPTLRRLEAAVKALEDAGAAK